MRLREVTGDNDRLQQPLPAQTRLVEVTNAGQKSQMTREEIEQLKERNDIRVHDEGDKAVILNRLR